MSEPCWTPWQFQSWQDGMKFTTREAAEALGLNPNTIRRYRKDGCSRVVALACMAIYGRHDEKPWREAA